MQPARACSSVVDKRSASVDRQTSCWGRQTTDWLTREMYKLSGGACSNEKNKVGQGKEVSRQVTTIPDGGVPTGPLGGLAPAVLGNLGVGSSWTREEALPSHCTCRAGSGVSQPQRAAAVDSCPEAPWPLVTPRLQACAALKGTCSFLH